MDLRLAAWLAGFVLAPAAVVGMMYPFWYGLAYFAWDFPPGIFFTAKERCEGRESYLVTLELERVGRPAYPLEIYYRDEWRVTCNYGHWLYLSLDGAVTESGRPWNRNKQGD